jgi:hypothetical protein
MANNFSGAIKYWFLRRASRKIKRTGSLIGYNQAKSFGIIYDASTEENYRRITWLVKDLQQDQKKVKTLGYVNLKKMPDYSFPKLTFEFCNYKDFSITQHPKAKNIKDFASLEFDILIDLTPANFDHMKYVSAISVSKMKVGRFNKNYIDIYDLLLQIDDNCTQDETINHMLHYIKMINNDTIE